MNKDLEFEEKRHQMRMEGLKYIRTTENLKHNWELERQQIKAAEIKKTMERKKAYKNGGY